MNRPNFPSRYLTALASLTLLTVQANAATIAQESYDGASTGFNSTVLQNGTVQTGLSYSQGGVALAIAGDSRLLNTSPQTGFTSPIFETQNYFLSFLLDSNAAGNLNGRAGLTLFAISNGPGGGSEVAEFGQNNVDGTGRVNILEGNFGTPDFSNIASNIETTEGTHLYVIQVNNSTSTLSLYYDPVPGVQPLTATLSFSSMIPFRLNNIRAFGAGVYDEFRVGDTFADVTPVPEPAAATLLVLTAGAVLLRRSRAA